LDNPNRVAGSHIRCGSPSNVLNSMLIEAVVSGQVGLRPSPRGHPVTCTVVPIGAPP
jgi:hypothetical protein